MSKIIDKIVPEIKLYKYLGKEIDELKRVFDRNWDEKGLDWKLKSINSMIERLQEELCELDEAMTEAWGDAFLVESLIRRLKQVLMEWHDCALVALMGADRTRTEIEAIAKRIRKAKKPTVEKLVADEIEGRLVESVVEEPEPTYKDWTIEKEYNGSNENETGIDDRVD